MPQIVNNLQIHMGKKGRFPEEMNRAIKIKMGSSDWCGSVGCHLMHGKVTSLIPSQFSCPGFGLNPQKGCAEGILVYSAAMYSSHSM